jgi:hypothetical protein
LMRQGFVIPEKLFKADRLVVRHSKAI